MHPRSELLYGRDNYACLSRSLGAIGTRPAPVTVEVEYELPRRRAVLVWVILAAAFVAALVIGGVVVVKVMFHA